MTACCFLLTSHTILLLATIVHRTPLAPYGYMLWCMRGVTVFYLATGIARLIWILDREGGLEAFAALCGHAEAL